ncbi:MAG: type II toxin-antitoxin system HicA family toxin [Isosphaeraceae bacterium]
MPRKIRELIRDLERAGFVDRGGKGDHKNFEHPRGLRVTLSGKAGQDAKPYQEKKSAAPSRMSSCERQRQVRQTRRMVGRRWLLRWSVSRDHRSMLPRRR